MQNNPKPRQDDPMSYAMPPTGTCTVCGTFLWHPGQSRCDAHEVVELRRQLSAVPKLSAESRRALQLGLEELEAANRMRLDCGGRECPELAGTLVANLHAARVARAELEGLP